MYTKQGQDLNSVILRPRIFHNRYVLKGQNYLHVSFEFLLVLAAYVTCTKREGGKCMFLVHVPLYLGFQMYI